METKLIENNDEIDTIFVNIKELVVASRNKVYSVVNTEMLNLYWNIGASIMKYKMEMNALRMVMLFLKSYPRN